VVLVIISEGKSVKMFGMCGDITILHEQSRALGINTKVIFYSQSAVLNNQPGISRPAL